MAGAPSAQDVADALAITIERQTSSGAPWCPPSDGMTVRRWVVDRGPSLGPGIRRAVRLARLFAIADGRDYVRFLYLRVSALRARHLRHALEVAVTEGRLHAGVATLSDRGVHLREAALAPSGSAQDPFEIDFAQMPRLAALLDFLHNALGFAFVADLLAPLLVPGPPTRPANEVAKALHAALNTWLSDRLASANHILQAQRIRAFLASRGRVTPDAVDDEGILLFWTTEAADAERVDGFRLYSSAARAMLRYRQSLRDAAAAKHLEESLGRGIEEESAAFAVASIEAGDTDVASWRSPLAALAAEPALRVKWLTGKEQRLLFNFLGGPADDADAQEPPAEDEPDRWKQGLGGDERFELAFWLTLLRADVFGAAQASIVARLRKREIANSAIAQAIAAFGDEAYATSAAAYVAVRNQLHLECLAALAVLMEAGAAEAAILLDHLGGHEAVRAVLGPQVRLASQEGGEALEGDDETIAGALRNDIALTLKAAIANPGSVPNRSGCELLLQALAATRKVSRIGFRREDRADPEIVTALKSGAANIVEVFRELDRLIAILSQRTPLGHVPSDRTRFVEAFQRMYAN